MAGKDKIRWHRKRHRIGDFQDWRCYYCDGIVACPHPDCFGNDVPLDYRATLDHVTPRAVGGGNEYENLVIACEPCNRDKADQILTGVQTYSLTEFYVDSDHEMTYAIGTRM